MSAIAGVFSRHDAERSPDEVASMLAVMASRGPDGTNEWADRRLTLGHGALHATPEAVHEQLPLVDPETGNVIVADVRLDNRSELIDRLGLTGHRPTELGDGRLILDAYRTWGEKCVERLLGDFTFAIWDEGRQQLFLARDHFGVRPLTYHSSDGLFAFASDSRAVVGLEGVSNASNRGRVFDFLVDRTEWTDTTGTFFEHVQRLPPAHTLTLSGDEQRLHRYWRLPEPEPLILGSDAEYEEATREVLDLAVSCRLRGRDDVGIMLSGGIDSASITAMAVDHGVVHTYSGISTDGDCVETSLISATAAMLPITSHTVNKSHVQELCGDFESAQRERENPFGNGSLPRTLFTTAAADGRRSILTGVLADEVVALSPGAASRAFVTQHAHRQLAQLVMADGNIHTFYGRLGVARMAAIELLSTSKSLANRRTTRRASKWADEKVQLIDETYLHLCLGERQALDQRLDSAGALWSANFGDGPGSVRHRVFDSGYATAALERYDRSAAACSVECRTPFSDRRVVEFFQSLPAQQLVGGGWTKSVLRRSMVGRLPEEVIWNRTKRHLGWSFTQEWLDIDPGATLGNLPSDHPLWTFTDMTDVVDKIRTDATLDWSLPFLILSLWLEGNFDT